MDLEKIAIERLKTAEELSLNYYQKPLLITYSGGKDSDVCTELARRAGIQFEVQHSHTTADAPETVYHVREKFRKLELEGIHCKIIQPMYKGKRTSMWDLIPQKLMPPTRLMRYCCQALKEGNGKNRAIVTGVRAAESVQRSTRGGIETIAATKAAKIIFENDNDDRRRMVEYCQTQGTIACNPILEWSNRDVWEYLRDSKVQTNPLYQCGFARVGCIGCPLASNMRHVEFRMFPAYREMYLKAFERMLIERKTRKKPTIWKTGDEVFRWWLEDKNLDGQLDFFGGEIGGSE